jgi:two-component system, NtrC family, nitrogen regulation sensor histidine kinase NtrY
LQNSSTFKRILFKNSYLLIIAACLVIISLIVDKVYTGYSSPEAVKKTVQNYVQDQERDFKNLLQDTVLIKKINDDQYDEAQLKQLTDKPYFIYRYFVNDIGLHQIIFWNTQTVLPTESVIAAIGENGMAKLGNGYYVWLKKTEAKSITIALIPVKWEYFITNNQLQNNFVVGKNIEKKYAVADTATPASIKSIAGNDLFYLAEKSANVVLERTVC